MTAVQKAYHLDDFARILADIPFTHVDQACVDYLSDARNVDERGRMIKPGAAHLRHLAYELWQTEQARDKPRIAHRQAGTEDFGRIAPQRDSIIFGGMPGSKYTREEYDAWCAERAHA